MRAKVVLLAAEGYGNNEIAVRLDSCREIVSKWRKRFFEERLAGLEERTTAWASPKFFPGGRRRSQGNRMRASATPRPALVETPSPRYPL